MEPELFIPLLEPDVSFDDLYGIEKRKSTLWKYIVYSVKLSFERPDLFPLGNLRDAKILLCGPPEIDMYHLAMAVAKELCARFIPMNCRETDNETDNYLFLDGVEKIKAVFSKAENNVPCVIFLKNIDSIRTPASNGEYSDEDFLKHNRFRYPLLKELNVCREKRREGVIVLASTNRFDLLDVYIYGKFVERFDIEPFNF
jgi:SpoVK/Ycf46/Vps4 family AAA+-type ATPase